MMIVPASFAQYVLLGKRGGERKQRVQCRHNCRLEQANKGAAVQTLIDG